MKEYTKGGVYWKRKHQQSFVEQNSDILINYEYLAEQPT